MLFNGILIFRYVITYFITLDISAHNFLDSLHLVENQRNVHFTTL
jgi:hypothetical protein